MDPSPIASPWIVFPIAAVILLVIAGHMIALRELPKGRMPESRRQIRIATGWVMMFAVPLTAYGFGIANTGEPEVFMVVWTSIVLLLIGVFGLSGADMVNSMRIHRKERAALKLDFRREQTTHEENDEGDDE